MDPLMLTWPGGEHPFRLGLGQLRALQDSCNAGPEEIFMRLRGSLWRLDDVLAVLRHGLIGGGMAEKEAGALVQQLAEAQPLADFKMPAYRVIRHALLGPEDDPVGKPKGEVAPPESGDSARSTAPAS